MVAARFLTIFLTLLPLALWGQLGGSWNHWATIPAEFIIAFFLFGIEEVSKRMHSSVCTTRAYHRPYRRCQKLRPTLPEMSYFLHISRAWPMHMQHATPTQ